MTDQLSLYNGALRMLGERKLASLSENRPPRYYLDDVWDDGAVEFCLEKGQWTFGTRAMRLDYEPSITPPFGYKYAFVKPDDYVRTTALCEDEWYRQPSRDSVDENGYWFSNLQVIYVKIVSLDPVYGLAMNLWTQHFKHCVHVYLAYNIMETLTSAPVVKKQQVAAEYKKLFIDARALDAMNKGSLTLPAGSWVTSRRGARGNSSYRGEQY